MYPAEFRYTEEHEWIEVEGDLGRVGITEYAQEELGDIVYVEVPEEGADLKSGEAFGVVESVKAVSDLYAPATGVVEEVNVELEDAPETLNQDPHGDGWIITIKLSDPAEVDELMSAEEYEQYIQSAGD